MKQQDSLSKDQEINIRKLEIQASVLFSMRRTSTTELDIENTVQDIISEFYHIPQEKIIKAIRVGSLGRYGLTYKLTTQQICIWIREFIKEEIKNRQL